MRNSISLSRRSLLMAGAGAMVGSASLSQTSKHKPIVLGQVSLSFYAVTGAIVHEVLERLGHQVEVREGPHEEMFPLLADDKIDLMAAVWLPEGHGAYWKKYGQNAVELTKLYNGARFFWAVPDYVPREELTSIEDLKKASVATRMTQTIQGIGSGATISVFSKKALEEYGLSDLGYSFRTGTQAEWIAEYNSAVADQRWIVFPTWAPQFLDRDGALRRLEDPKGVLGGDNHGSLVAARGRLDVIPEPTLRVLRHIDIGLRGVIQMDWWVNVDKKTPREAARAWMEKNHERTSRWFEA